MTCLYCHLWWLLMGLFGGTLLAWGLSAFFGGRTKPTEKPQPPSSDQPKPKPPVTTSGPFPEPYRAPRYDPPEPSKVR